MTEKPASDASDDRPTPPVYPGPRQILRYLRIVQENHDDNSVSARTPALDDLLDPGGAMYLGAIAPMCDLIAGSVSRHEVAPDWVATLEFKIHLVKPVAAGWVHARCATVRATKNNILSSSRLHDDAGEAVGLTYATFSRLPYRDDNPRITSFMPRAVTDYRSDEEEPRIPFDEYLGLRFTPGETHIELDHHERIYNSFGSIQGGAMAALLERAGAHGAQRVLGRPARSTDLHFQYLAQARVGPFRLTTEVIRADDRSVLSLVELVDVGQDLRLAAVGTTLAVPIDSRS